MKRSLFMKGLQCLVMFALISFCSHAWAVVLYVAADAGSGGDGRSWQTAYRNISTALTYLNWSPPTKYPQIWVKRGTYTLTAPLCVSKYVQILGGFNGTENSSSQRNCWWYRTNIDGGHAHRCLNITSSCVIDGFTIRNGHYPYTGGGGIHISNASASIRNCVIQNNDSHGGGGVYLTYSNSSFKNCYFRDNEGDYFAGGVYLRYSNSSFKNCYFIGNEGDSGGAIYHYRSSPTIEKCSFRDNISFGGGAIAGYNRHPNNRTPKITNCLFSNNQSHGYGGAISHNQVFPTITNCTFTQNTANGFGGAYYGFMNSEGPRIRNSIMWGNWPDELDIDTHSSRLDVSFSDIEGGWTGPGMGNIDVDPHFRGTSDFRLSEGSDCIDAGSNGYSPSDDFLGTPRPLDGDGDGVAISDMGAYEYIP